MRKRRFRLAKIVFLLIFASVAVWALQTRIISLPDNNFTEVTPTEEKSTDYNFTIVQVADTGRRVSLCQQEKCQSLAPAPVDSSDAVTDSRSWYYYQAGVLKRAWLNSGQTDIIIDQTPLVKPRGLIISPDNSKIAFWLDNVDDPTKQLTELWTYEANLGITKLLAEKINQSAVLTKPRWNRSANHLWFIGDTSTADDEESKIELLVVSLNPPGISAKFTQIDWPEMESLAAAGPMDISSDGQSLAYVQPKTRRTSSLITVRNSNKPQATTVRGTVPYIQWLQDGTLLYATQDKPALASDQPAFTFWQMKDNHHNKLARVRGQLKSVRATDQGNYLAYVSASNNKKVSIFTLDIKYGTITKHHSLPVYGRAAHLVHTESAAVNIPSVAGTNQLPDSIIASFIEKHLAEIAGSPHAQPQRLLISNQQNTVYIEFTDGHASSKRLLITILDAIHPEWSVNARYASRSGEWIKSEGGGHIDPPVVRLYEWETSLNQWILKDNFNE